MSDVTTIDIGGAIAAHRRWFMLLGVLLIIAGILSIVFPFVGSIAVEVWTAVMLLIVGGAQIAHAFATSNGKVSCSASSSVSSTSRLALCYGSIRSAASLR